MSRILIAGLAVLFFACGGIAGDPRGIERDGSAGVAGAAGRVESEAVKPSLESDAGAGGAPANEAGGAAGESHDDEGGSPEPPRYFCDTSETLAECTGLRGTCTRHGAERATCGAPTAN